ncbi:helix-turn-helix domain-containing protein [Candidatus Chlorohelix sp.]|uniref:helix-turn-helix domain-containing protein n=1 Tax=Candidatus Chlorohelix sp. TaxID=3139201 RepID=UPI00302883E4
MRTYKERICPTCDKVWYHRNGGTSRTRQCPECRAVAHLPTGKPSDASFFIEPLLEAGYTQTAIAKKFGVSRQRIHQLVKRLERSGNKTLNVPNVPTQLNN